MVEEIKSNPLKRAKHKRNNPKRMNMVEAWNDTRIRMKRKTEYEYNFFTAIYNGAM